MKSVSKILTLIIVAAIFFACSNKEAEEVDTATLSGTDVENEDMFELIPTGESGLDFANTITEDARINYFNFMHLYMGAGVAVGDVNNDGLQDIYFTGTLVTNKLYLNRGNMVFEDITEKAGVDGGIGFTTGVTMVDINQDGWLDIYVCQSGWFPDTEYLKNKLFINNGDETFTESADSYGLADRSHSIQSNFFDYDNDGDLDVYVINTPVEFDLSFKYIEQDKIERNTLLKTKGGDDRLYRNEGNGKFVDVSRSAGILFDIGFGLSVTTGDINHDGWIDIYVANDFLQPDFFYINNGDGTFSEKSKEMLKHMSFYSMGADIADFNNDGLLDILVVDMMAEDNYRQKTMMAAMSTDNFWRSVEYGYHYQYMHNILQVNNGNGTFSEIANLSGIDKSDWSWNPILIDFDNDGLKDFFVTNGIKRDVTDNDFRDKIYNSGSEKTLSVEDALNLAPSTKISNVIYKNNGDLTFTKKTQSWGMDIPSFSNGAAYADFDLDGDLDLVINNVDEPAFLFRNNADRSQGNNYLRIDLVGNKLNMSGLGTKVKLFIDNEVQYLEHGVTKGYMSCQEDILHFGVGKVETIDSIEIIWLDGKYHKLYDVAVNQVLILNQKDPAQTKPGTKQGDELLFVDVTGKYGIDFTHLENKYDDYENEILLPHRMSQFGPSIAVGDVNGDGLDDFYIGGAAEQSGQLNVQNQNGTFIRTNIVTWEQDKNYEDLGALFFDADGDGDLDLYVVSGSSEFQINSTDLQDRLYINNGEGSFTRDEDALPQFYASGSCVVAEDYDQDGDQDLFVGGRVIPGRYPFPPRSYLLQNNGGTFTDVTKAIAPDLISPGMVTSAVWNDYDEDGDMDLVVVGEWMPISFYNNDNGVFTDKSFDHGMEYTTGWWNKVMAADIDMDGDDDFLLGNLGLNYKFKVSREEPLHIYCDDFDDNGSLDIVLGWYLEGECFPVRGRECSSDQMPNIKDKFKNYNAFGNATIADVYGDRLNTALQHYEANLFASSYMRNDGDGNFTISSLPLEAQFSTVFGILVEDFNSDGNLDVLVAGNFYVSEVETGRADAGIGLFMSGNNNGDFKPATVLSSGFFAPHDTRDLALLNTNRIGEYLILVANNNYKLQVYQVKMNGKNQGGDQLTLK